MCNSLETVLTRFPLYIPVHTYEEIRVTPRVTQMNDTFTILLICYENNIKGYQNTNHSVELNGTLRKGRVFSHEIEGYFRNKT